MIITDSGEVKVGDIVLPGLFKSLEVESDAKVDEVEVKGRSTKPKQATGYEDAKIKIKLILMDDASGTMLDQLGRIQAVFRKPSQEKPQVFDLFNHHCNARGITKIIFKRLRTAEDNKSNLLEVECEFWEYIPVTITAVAASGSGTTAGAAATGTPVAVSDKFRAYLNGRTEDQQKAAELAAQVDGQRYQAAYAAYQKQQALRASQVDAKRYEAMAKQATSKRSDSKLAASPAVDNDEPSYKGRWG